MDFTTFFSVAMISSEDVFMRRENGAFRLFELRGATPFNCHYYNIVMAKI